MPRTYTLKTKNKTDKALVIFDLATGREIQGEADEDMTVQSFETAVEAYIAARNDVLKGLADGVKTTATEAISSKMKAMVRVYGPKVDVFR